MTKSIFPATVLVVLLASAAFSSFFIETHFFSGQASGNLEEVLARTIGSAKEAIGDTFFLKADSYYHGGVAEGSEEEREAEDKKAPGDWIETVNRQVRSYEHRELDKDLQKEMLPFFAMATRLDPHNIEAILTTAYWLDRNFNKTDAAIEVLTKGLKDNSDAWEIDLDMAKIYFQRKKDYALAKRFCLEALRKSEGKKMGARDKANIDFYLRESDARLGSKTDEH